MASKVNQRGFVVFVVYVEHSSKVPFYVFIDIGSLKAECIIVYEYLGCLNTTNQKTKCPYANNNVNITN